MKTVTYVVLVSVAFTAILLNALYGHYVYGSPHDQALSKYAIYVHLDPQRQPSSANILYDITISWNGTPSQSETAHYNSNSVQNIGSRQAVLLQHGFSDCQTGWNPPLYRYGADLLRSTINYIQGIQLNQDPYTPIFADMQGYAQDGEHIPKGYVQFIPVCTNANSPSFRYAISSNDNDISFDVHFVPSEKELGNYLYDNSTFSEYAGCNVSNHHRYTGFCSNVGPDSGLLIVLSDNLKHSLTRLSVNLHEVTSIPAAESIQP